MGADAVTQLEERDAETAFTRALVRGETDALAKLVERYGPRIHNFASRMCRSAEDAKDVVQQTFLFAMGGLKDFRAESTLSTWLFRIAANACRKMRRRGKFEPARHLTLEEFLPTEQDLAVALAEPPESPEEALRRTDLRAALEGAIAELPAPYRAVLILRDLDGMSTDETARALGLTGITVRVRLHRARLFVRQRLMRGALSPRETLS
jgi:RNA polymerase sigma-70 factor, ECF subfamily